MMVNGPAVDLHETALCPAGAALLRGMLAPLAWNTYQRRTHALLQLVENNPAALGGRCMDRTRYNFARCQGKHCRLGYST